MAARLVVFSDIHCPYAYLAAWRLRQVLPEFEGRVEVEHKSLAIEYLDEKPTPKDILDAETPLILLDAPDLPYAGWRAADWAWPVTLWPAFEAVKCAQRQGWRAAHELDWRLREAFFGRSECVAMRHVILRLARGVDGIDAERFERDFDAGVGKQQVVDEAREGWDELDLEVSPTFVLPSGERLANLAGPKVALDEDRGQRVVEHRRSPEGALDAFRDMLERTVSERVSRTSSQG